MIVLDTNVVSELMRTAPEPGVLAWLERHRDEVLLTTAVTVAEIGYGIARLPAGRRRLSLAQAAGEIFASYPEQILPFDVAAAVAYAQLVTQRDRLGVPIDGFDAQIVAICRCRGAALATRNTKDFLDTGITLIDPWTA